VSKREFLGPVIRSIFAKCQGWQVIQAINLTPDRFLISVGLATAIGSTIFATAMIGREQNGTGNDGSGLLRAISRAQHAKVLQSSIGERKQDLLDSHPSGDDITGSISQPNVIKPPQREVLPNPIGKPPLTNNSEGWYVLRFVHNDTALLQNGKGLYVARRGTILPGVGRVLSVEKRGHILTVVTTGRVFANRVQTH